MAPHFAKRYMRAEVSLMEKAATIVTGGAALVMAVATALLGFTIPSMWTLQSDMGAAKATLASIDKKLDAYEKKLDTIQAALDQIAKRADGIDNRLSQKETDPAALVALSGLRPATLFSGLSANGKFYLLPRSDEAMVELANAGLKREAITPTAFGYVFGTYDPSGALILTTGSAGFTPQDRTAPAAAPRSFQDK